MLPHQELDFNLQHSCLANVVVFRRIDNANQLSAHVTIEPNDY